MITAAAIYAPTASDIARTPAQVAGEIEVACGVRLIPAGWATFIAETATGVESVRAVATVARVLPMDNGWYAITLAA